MNKEKTDSERLRDLETITSAILQCGYADLSMIENMNMDIDEVLQSIEDCGERISLQSLLTHSIYIIINKLDNIIENKQEEKEEEIRYLESKLEVCAYGRTELQEIEVAKSELEELQSLCASDDIDYFVNYLDTSIFFVTSDEKKKLYKQYFEKEIESLNNELGFTSLELD